MLIKLETKTTRIGTHVRVNIKEDSPNHKIEKEAFFSILGGQPTRKDMEDIFQLTLNNFYQ